MCMYVCLALAALTTVCFPSRQPTHRSVEAPKCGALSCFLQLREGRVPFSMHTTGLACPTKMAFNSQGCTQVLCHPSQPKTSPTPASSQDSWKGRGTWLQLEVQKHSWLRICLWELQHGIVPSHLLCIKAPGQG